MGLWRDQKFCIDNRSLSNNNGSAYYSSPYHRERKTIGIFEMFVRKLPKNRSFVIVAGVEQVIQYVLNLRYDDEQIAYLQSLEVFKDVNKEFFDYLRRFKFNGSLWSVPEGTVLIPNEPILRIEFRSLKHRY